MPLAELSVTVIDSTPPRLEVGGELDLSTAGHLTARVRTTDASGDVVLDLRAVSFMDSRGMLALLHAQRDLRARGGELVLAEVSPSVRRVLELTRVWELFPRHEPDRSSLS
jgi:stage II sporulation protein AA (anti-sigma F factor antagonist)